MGKNTLTAWNHVNIVYASCFSFLGSFSACFFLNPQLSWWIAVLQIPAPPEEQRQDLDIDVQDKSHAPLTFLGAYLLLRESLRINNLSKL